MKISELESFKEQIAEQLQKPLPGREAQAKMAPRPVDERRFREDESNPARLGGVLILFYPDENGIHIPLMKRTEYKGAHSGQISFPGGKLEKHDEDLVQTALREAEEEIGVPTQEIEILGNLSEMFIVASNFKVLPTVAIMESKPKFIPDPVEVQELIPMPLTTLRDENLRKVKEMHFPPYKIFSPYYEVRGEVVWGATAMMLSELEYVLNRVDYR